MNKERRLFLEGVLAGKFLKAYERGQIFAAMILAAADDPERRSEILREQPEAAKRFEQMTTPELEAQMVVWPTAVAVADVVAAALEIVLPIQDELLPKPEGGAEQPQIQPPQTDPTDSN